VSGWLKACLSRQREVAGHGGSRSRWKQVVRGGRWVGETERCVLDGLVGGGEPALVLAEVFLPGGDPELFDEPVAAVGVTVQLPPGGPGAQP
jgi:hypothetical protein